MSGGVTRVGIVILPDQPWAQARHRWRRAEEYGFAHAWTYDHLGWRDLVDGPWFDAVPTLTAAAGVTTRIRLGTLVASPNFRHPVEYARSVTAIDDVSGGRLTLGIGAGGLAGFDTEVLGGPPLSAGAKADRFTEFVELLDALLVDGRVSRRGRYYTAVDARSTPGCVQQPRVPFLIAANGPRTMRLAARFGQGWITTGARRDEGLDAWWAAVRAAADRFTEVAGDAQTTRHLSLDAAPVYSLSSVDAFTDAVGRATELGFTDVAVHWPRPSSWYAGDEAILDTIADLLPGL
jgi:alkanesulfonate monooxygenase SsuD/methylene tetrahydromethanopterin reductase-like flavin-dependent oxidoreductase (luciferase family)